MPSAIPKCPRIAYLTGEYPRASHTFIEREIAALRTLGVAVRPMSIRRAGAGDLIGPEEEAAARETFYVLAAAKRPLTLLKAHVAGLVRAPGRYLSTLALAFRTRRRGLKGTLWQLFYFLEAGVLAAELRREDVSHLHNHFADSSASVAMLAGALADIPFSFTLHGPAELFEPESWALGEKVARAAFTICISHFARSQAMLFSDPEHWPRLKIVHCGVTPERYTPTPRETEEGLRLLFVGRLTAIKGLRVLFKALEELRTTHPGVTLSLIGDGPDRAWAEVEAQRLGGIEILGYRSQEEVAQALAEADALVLPSFAEGVPVVLMEAMASGLPVIATRVGGVSELVEEGVSGLLVAPGDTGALAQAIIRLGDDPKMRVRMGAEGRAKVSAEFDVAIEARRLLALYTGRGGDGPRPDPVDPS